MSDKAEKIPGVFAIAGMAWSVLLDAVETMPSVFLVGVIALLIVKMVMVELTDVVTATLTGGGLLLVRGIVLEIVSIFTTSLVYAAIAIPVHRLNVLNETRDEGLSLFSERTVRFALWASAFSLAAAGVIVLGGLAAAASEAVAPILYLLSVLTVFATVFISFRLSLVFPAVAADHANGPTLDVVAWVWRLGRGNGMRLVFSPLLAMLPLLFAAAAIGFICLGIIGAAGVDAAHAMGWLRHCSARCFSPLGSRWARRHCPGSIDLPWSGPGGTHSGHDFGPRRDQRAMASDHTAAEHLAVDFGIVLHAWGTLRRALTALPKVFISTALAAGLLTYAAWKLQSRYHDLLAAAPQALRPFVDFGYTLAVDICDCVVLAAIAVPVHRLVLLGERHDGTAPFFSGRTWRSALWLVLFEMIGFLALLPLPFLMSASAWETAAIVAGMILFLIACFVVVLRAMLIFPAIATDRDAHIVTSWRLSRGHFWRLFITLVFAMIPLLFAILLATLAASAIVGQSSSLLGVMDTLMWLQVAVNAITHPLVAALAAAVLAWNYSLARSEIAERGAA